MHPIGEGYKGQMGEYGSGGGWEKGDLTGYAKIVLQITCRRGEKKKKTPDGQKPKESGKNQTKEGFNPEKDHLCEHTYNQFPLWPRLRK